MIVPLIVVIIFAGGIGAVMLWLVLDNIRREEKLELAIQRTKGRLEQEGFKIFNGMMHGCVMIVSVDTDKEFIQICKRIGAKNVFRDFDCFYAFTEDWQLGYRYRVKP
jgi:hypothetical protein